MNILFGTDHAGFEMKEALKAFVRDELGYMVEDMGAHEYDETDDYPDFVKKVALRICEADAQGTAHSGVFGIILGGSGQGEAMCANRYRGVRAAVYYGGTTDNVMRSREHNDANVLSLGARFMNVDEAKAAVRLWLSTPFRGEERHVRRIRQMDDV